MAPLACEAFEDFVLGGERFSRDELAVLRALLNAGGDAQEQLAARAREHGMGRKETERLLAKLAPPGEA